MPYGVIELLFVHQLGQPPTLWFIGVKLLPIEMEIQSLRVLVEAKVLEEDWLRQRYEQSALIDVKRMEAQYHAQGYQKRIARSFYKKVKPRNHKEGDLVLKVLRDELSIQERR